MKKTVLILILLCFGCKHQVKPPALHVSLENNNHSVKFTGLDYAIVSEINRDSVPDVWEKLLPVYRLPADTDMKDYQPIQHGKYRVKDSAVVFTPDTPFAKGKIYFMRYYQFGGSNNVWDFVTGKKRLRGMHYIDLIFKH
jgi:hypothetical protein